MKILSTSKNFLLLLIFLAVLLFSILALTISDASSSNIYNPKELNSCEVMRNYAQIVMLFRQRGEPKETFVELLCDTDNQVKGLAYIVELAYIAPVLKNERMKKVIVNMFGEQVYKSCSEELK